MTFQIMSIIQKYSFKLDFLQPSSSPIRMDSILINAFQRFVVFQPLLILFSDLILLTLLFLRRAFRETVYDCNN